MRAVLLLLLLAGPALAQQGQPARLIPPFEDRGTVTLRNATAQPLSQIFFWSHGMPPEGRDWLEGVPLPPGGTRELALGMGHCNNELRARFANGEQFHTAPVPVCHAREVVLEAGTPPTARVIPK